MPHLFLMLEQYIQHYRRNSGKQVNKEKQHKRNILINLVNIIAKGESQK